MTSSIRIHRVSPTLRDDTTRHDTTRRDATRRHSSHSGLPLFLSFFLLSVHFRFVAVSVCKATLFMLHNGGISNARGEAGNRRMRERKARRKITLRRVRSLQLIAVRPNGSSIRVNTVAITSRPNQEPPLSIGEHEQREILSRVSSTVLLSLSVPFYYSSLLPVLSPTLLFCSPYLLVLLLTYLGYRDCSAIYFSSLLTFLTSSCVYRSLPLRFYARLRYRIGLFSFFLRAWTINKRFRQTAERSPAIAVRTESRKTSRAAPADECRRCSPCDCPHSMLLALRRTIRSRSGSRLYARLYISEIYIYVRKASFVS